MDKRFRLFLLLPGAYRFDLSRESFLCVKIRMIVAERAIQIQRLALSAAAVFGPWPLDGGIRGAGVASRSIRTARFASSNHLAYCLNQTCRCWSRRKCPSCHRPGRSSACTEFPAWYRVSPDPTPHDPLTDRPSRQPPGRLHHSWSKTRIVVSSSISSSQLSPSIRSRNEHVIVVARDGIRDISKPVFPFAVNAKYGFLRKRCAVNSFKSEFRYNRYFGTRFRFSFRKEGGNRDVLHRLKTPRKPKSAERTSRIEDPARRRCLILFIRIFISILHLLLILDAAKEKDASICFNVIASRKSNDLLIRLYADIAVLLAVFFEPFQEIVRQESKLPAEWNIRPGLQHPVFSTANTSISHCESREYSVPVLWSSK